MPSHGYFSVLHKILEKVLWNSFLLYLLVKFWNLIWYMFLHDISSFPAVLFKVDVLENFSKLTDKNKKQSSGGVQSKDVLKNLAEFTEKHFCWSLYFNKIVSWKPEFARSSHWRCSVKKIVLKDFANLQENTCARVSFEYSCSSEVLKLY